MLVYQRIINPGKENTGITTQNTLTESFTRFFFYYTLVRIILGDPGATHTFARTIFYRDFLSARLSQGAQVSEDKYYTPVYF